MRLAGGRRGWVHEREDALRIIKGKDSPVPGVRASGRWSISVSCCHWKGTQCDCLQTVSTLSVILDPHSLLDI